MTRIEALRKLVCANQKACRFLDRGFDESQIKEALNNPARLVGALIKGARLRVAEVDRLVDALVKRQGFVAATAGDVETVLMQSRF